MPIYEYRCQDCRARVSVFLRSFTAEASPTCDRCGGHSLARLVSRFAFFKSEESRMEDLESQAWLNDVDQHDPKSVAQWMKRMRREIGSEMGPEMDETVEMLESGQMPEDLAGPDGDMSGAGGHDFPD